MSDIDMDPVALPTSFNFFITNRCNARCRMCNIWQTDQHNGKTEELSLEEIRQVFKNSELLQEIRHVSLSGGEPFLRDDLVNLFGYFRAERDCIVAISTNGLLTNRIMEFVSQMYKDYLTFPNISLSLDGIGETHDRIRGVPGAFEKAMSTLDALLPYRVNLTLNFTITPENFQDLWEVYLLAKKHRLGLGTRFAQNGAIYLNDRLDFSWTADQLDQVTTQIREILHDRLGQGLMNSLEFMLDNSNYFLDRSVHFAGQQPKRRYRCYSGIKSFALMPDGSVKPCIMLEKGFGNLRDQAFDELWVSAKPQQARESIAKQLCNCWTECETMHSLRHAEREERLGKMKMLVRNSRTWARVRLGGKNG